MISKDAVSPTIPHQLLDDIDDGWTSGPRSVCFAGWEIKAASGSALARDVRKGRMLIVEDAWTHAFPNQLKDFPGGRLIDMADAAAGAHLVLEGTLGDLKPKRRIITRRHLIICAMRAANGVTAQAATNAVVAVRW